MFTYILCIMYPIWNIIYTTDKYHVLCGGFRWWRYVFERDMFASKMFSMKFRVFVFHNWTYSYASKVEERVWDVWYSLSGFSAKIWMNDRISVDCRIPKHTVFVTYPWCMIRSTSILHVVNYETGYLHIRSDSQSMKHISENSSVRAYRSIWFIEMKLKTLSLLPLAYSHTNKT